MWKPVDGIRCDRPMAEKKGILPYCDHKCKECMAGIRREDPGREGHFRPTKDYKIRQRNLDYLNGGSIR